jgi:hypothetical protein
MKKNLIVLLVVLLGALAIVLACGGGDDDDNDASDDCDLDGLTAATEEVCNTPVVYKGQMESADACGQSCSQNQVAYWWEEWEAVCTNQCFCCEPAA